jgi:hypothetical protein
MDRVLAYAEGHLQVAGGFLTLHRGRRKAVAVRLSDVRSATVEERKAFRHPLLGLIFALALLLPAVGTLAAVLAQGNLAALEPLKLGAAVVFAVIVGSWVLYEVITSPRVCWLRIRSAGGEQRLALPGVSRPELEELAAALGAGGETA